MRVAVLFFAALREAAGAARRDVELPEGATLADLKETLAVEIPALRGALERFEAESVV